MHLNLQPGWSLSRKRSQDFNFIFICLTTATVKTLLTTIPASPSAQQEIRDPSEQTLEPLQTKVQDYNPSIAIEKKHSAVFVFLQQNIKNDIYFIYTNRQVLCSYQPNPTDAITRQENKHSLQVFSSLKAMYYYVGWQEGDLQSTMAQQYAGVETCLFLHTHQQSNRSANIQQKELKTEGKWKHQINPARIYLINIAMWTHFIPVDVPVIFVQSIHMEHCSPTNSPQNGLTKAHYPHASALLLWLI